MLSRIPFAKVLYLASVTFAFVTFTLAQNQPSSPRRVDDANTAVSIAEKILIQKFGSRVVKEERPFTARLKANVWHVSGSDCGAEHCFGAPAVVEISKEDGRILAVYGPQR